MNGSVRITGALALGLASALSLGSIASAGAQSPAPAPSTRVLTAAQTSDIDAYVERAMREWGDVAYRPGLAAVMEPWQHNTFRLAWKSPNVYDVSSNGRFLATFDVDATGKPVSLTGNIIGTFRALPARPARASGSSPSGMDQ